MQVGNRIYYDKTGKILFQTGEINEGFARPLEEDIKYIDVNYGAIDYSKSRIVSVDVSINEPIIEQFVEDSEEEKIIKSLQDDVELLKSEIKNGGIL